jgi:hypothetical protein
VPDGNNVYGFLPDGGTPEAAARRFAAAGWEIRKSSWTEYEVATGWCELELFDHDGLTFAGAVRPDRVDDLAAVLRDLGFAFTLELYDDHGVLLREVTSGPVG